ncbi:MAG TPA: hypothetical protein VF092_19905 [Longimicrobium sp.]
MRLHSIAAAAALAALVACSGGTPVTVRPAELVGSWKSDVVFVNGAATPDGARNLERTETWTFAANGRYSRQALQYDPLSGRSYTEYVDEGTWTVASDRVLELKPERQFYTPPLQPATNPTLVASSGYTSRYSFGIDANVLSASWICPANASCVHTPPLSLHRVQQLLGARSPR